MDSNRLEVFHFRIMMLLLIMNSLWKVEMVIGTFSILRMMDETCFSIYRVCCDGLCHSHASLVFWSSGYGCIFSEAFSFCISEKFYFWEEIVELCIFKVDLFSVLGFSISNSCKAFAFSRYFSSFNEYGWFIWSFSWFLW